MRALWSTLPLLPGWPRGHAKVIDNDESNDEMVKKEKASPLHFEGRVRGHFIAYRNVGSPVVPIGEMYLNGHVGWGWKDAIFGIGVYRTNDRVGRGGGAPAVASSVAMLVWPSLARG